MKDGEFDEDTVRKHYRNKYRDHLVKSGKIPAIEASADDIAALNGQKEEEQVKPNKKSKTAKASKGMGHIYLYGKKNIYISAATMIG